MKDLGGLSFLMPNCRNSGEMSTSLTNTLISKYLIKYALHELNITEKDYFVEGDDNWTAFNSKKSLTKLVKQILEIYSGIGCEATVESCGDIDSEPTFCKIKFVNTEKGLVGFKELPSALMKATWLDSKYQVGNKTFNKILIAKLHSLVHQYNYWPALVDLMNDVVTESQKTIRVDLRAPPTWIKYYTEKRDAAAQGAVTNAQFQLLDTLYGSQLK